MRQKEGKQEKAKEPKIKRRCKISFPPYAAQALRSSLNHCFLFSSRFCLLESPLAFPHAKTVLECVRQKEGKQKKVKKPKNQKAVQKYFFFPYAAGVLRFFLTYCSLFSPKSLSILPSFQFDIRSFLISTCSLLIVHHLHSVWNRLRLRTTNRT